MKEEPNTNESLNFIHVKANQVRFLIDIAKGEEISTQNIVGHDEQKCRDIQNILP